jgi:hypothetical protein
MRRILNINEVKRSMYIDLQTINQKMVEGEVQYQPLLLDADYNQYPFDDSPDNDIYFWGVDEPRGVTHLVRD